MQINALERSLRDAISQRRAGSGDPYAFSASAVRVAQTASLLYRRMPSCRTAHWPLGLSSTSAAPIDNRRLARSLPLARSLGPLLCFAEQSPFAASQAAQVQQINNRRYAKHIRGL